MSKTIRFFDTTLRDGEQTPGITLNMREKLEIAKQLSHLGVDIIEAGFPNSSIGDFKAVQEIAKTVQGASVAGLCRALPMDVQRAWEALKFAEAPRIHIFIATSEIHMLHKLKMTEHEVIEAAVNAVKMAKSFCNDVEFSAEDASRTNPAFLYRILSKVIAAGATTVNIPDTVGYTMPQEYAQIIRGIFENVSNIDKAAISVHCHNDLGLAVANSLAAIKAGATQVECTVNGIGERAGNAALEEIVMALRTREDFFDAAYNIKTEKIYSTSRLVANYTGLEISPNKAIVGTNAFRHQSGIHQHGMLMNSHTYQIMSPETVGVYDVDTMVLGKLSGRHAFEEKVREMGYHLSEHEMADAFAKFKALADRKKDITARDITAILDGHLTRVAALIGLDDYQIFSSNHASATATIALSKGEEKLRFAAIGDGPVDAAYHAIDSMLNMGITLEAYTIKAVTEGKDALGEVTVKVRYGKEIYMGKGISTDVIESSILSYINAINRILADYPDAIATTN